MKIIFVLFLFLLGCDPFKEKLKCQDGVIYIRADGAWVQALMYKDNKCLPLEDGK